MKIFITIFFPVILCFSLYGESTYQTLLNKYVKNARVDYKGLKKEVINLDKVIKSFEKVDDSKMNHNQKMALWINAYNACTLKLIVDYLPLKSINDIPKAKRWKHARWIVAGQKVSLDDMEHKVLRKMGDPRIHFAINCASFSCPDLSSIEFQAEKLDKQLEAAEKIFFENKKKGIVYKKESSFFGGTNHILYVSKIFSWFSSDFVEKEGSIEKYIRKNATGDISKTLKNVQSIKIKYLNYDWNLNN